MLESPPERPHLTAALLNGLFEHSVRLQPKNVLEPIEAGERHCPCYIFRAEWERRCSPADGRLHTCAIKICQWLSPFSKRFNKDPHETAEQETGESTG